MAHTAHEDPEKVKEHHDPPDVLEKKIQKLYDMVRNSKHMVAFTGAGISTSSGIGDFRGPEGKWTRKAQGLEPLSGTSSVNALPTKAHMALVQLLRQGRLKYVISQNCDGLHRRSGIPASSISELHGNGNIEVCEDCGRHYLRDFKCVRRLDRSAKGDHFTGRFCKSCSGRLLEFSIDFGQTLPTQPLEKAEDESQKADLHIVLGSSLKVSPACGLPKKTASKRGGQLVIVNLQETDLDSKAALKINARTDVVMEMLMERLGISIPPFRLERRILITQEGNSVFAKAVDVHDPDVEVGVLCGVDWEREGKVIPESERAKAIWQNVVHQHPSQNLDLHALRPTLHFVGHYKEPPITLDVDLADGGKDILISFDPLAGTWSIKATASIETEQGAEEGHDRDSEYGVAHREYVVKCQKGNTADPEKYVEQQFEEARRRAEAYAAAWIRAEEGFVDRYSARQDDVTVFKYCESAVAARKLKKGEIIMAAGAPQDVDGFSMVPIFPFGAVELKFLRKLPECPGTAKEVMVSGGY